MKILHILDHSLPLHSGYTFRSQNIFIAQRNRGWQPVILTSPKHEESWQTGGPGKEIINGLTYYRTGRLPVASLPMESELRIMWALGRRMLQVAKFEKPDVIHAHSPVLNAIPALVVGRLLKIPVVYEIRAFWEDAAVDHGTYSENSWKYNVTKKLETWVCRHARHVAILCNGLKNDLIKRGIGGDKITCIFNAINPDDFKPCPPDNEFLEEWGLKGKKVIGFVGSFYRYEGLDLLIESFSRVAALYPDAMLLLVGGGETENELKVTVQKLNLQKRVVMPGRIPHDRIPGVYALVDILAYPRYSMRLTELVTPLKPLEAMAMGKVLVASDIGGHRELITNNETGVLFRAGKVEELTEAIVKLLEDKAFYEDIREKGNQWVRKKHIWSKTTAAYVDVYNRVVE